MERKRSVAAVLVAYGHDDGLIAKVIIRSPDTVIRWKQEPDFQNLVEKFRAMNTYPRQESSNIINSGGSYGT